MEQKLNNILQMRTRLVAAPMPAWLALLVLLHTRAVRAITVITEADPTNHLRPLLPWPKLKIQPFRQALKCVPDHHDPNFPEVKEVRFKRDGFPDNNHEYGPGRAQNRANDPYYQLGTIQDNGVFAGTWTCQWWITIQWQNRTGEWTSVPSPGFKISEDEKELACGVPFQDMPSFVPYRYVQIGNGRKKRASATKKISSKHNPKSEKIIKVPSLDNQTNDTGYDKTNDKIPDFGKLSIGEDIDIFYLPWVVSIIYNHQLRVSLGRAGGYWRKYKKFRCTGALLSRLWVITAADCLPDVSPPSTSYSCQVFGGEGFGYFGDPKPCRTIVKHTWKYINVALIQLFDKEDPLYTVQDTDLFRYYSVRNKRGPNSVYASNICLPDVKQLNYFDNQECYMAGFGLPNDPYPGFYPLKAIKVKMESIENQLIWKHTTPWSKESAATLMQFVNHHVFLSGVKGDYGDGGAPIVCRVQGGGPQWQLAGIYSKAFTLNFQDKHGLVDIAIGQRVSTLKGWIEAYIGRNARNVFTLGLPKELHSCGEQDYKCGSVQCIPWYWFTKESLESFRQYDKKEGTTLLNYLQECKTRLNIISGKVPGLTAEIKINVSYPKRAVSRGSGMIYYPFEPLKVLGVSFICLLHVFTKTAGRF